MAGGDNPRQRMINMMYLVLTALLALQVSASIIEKFIFLYRSMDQAKQNSEAGSQAALKALEKKASKEKNSKDAKQAVKRAHELVKQTAKVNAEIDKIMNELKEFAGGGEDHHHVVKNPKEETKVEVKMIGANKDGLGYKLQKILNKQVAWFNRKAKEWDLKLPKFPEIALDNKDNPIYKDEKDPLTLNKDFANSNFGQTPVIAALAIIVQKQNELINYEQQILQKLGADDLAAGVKFDKIMAFAAAEATVIATGQDYKAKLILTATSDKLKPKMSVSSGSLKMMKGGVGDVTIPAGSSAGERSWTGTISFKDPKTQRDTTFKTEALKFTVVEPTLIVNTQGGFPLYKNCANELQTSVPALGAGYEPSFGVNNGSVVPGSKIGDCTIFPSKEGDCVLTVRSSGINVGNKKFKVIPVPPPNVYLAGSNGRKVSLDKPIPAPPRLQVKADPDPTFERTLPKEAKYQVVGLEITQFRGGASVKSKRENSGSFTFSSVYSPRRGDGFNVKVTGVNRINSRGNIEPAPILRPNIQFTTR